MILEASSKLDDSVMFVYGEGREPVSERNWNFPDFKQNSTGKDL